MPNAFYVKCRPQGADITWIALEHKRVFIGYPPVRIGGSWSRERAGDYLLDIGGSDWTLDQLHPNLDSGYRKQVSQNRNMAREVTSGCMVVLPRPGEGVCYIGKVVGTFELVNNPTWADAYLDARRTAGLRTDPEQDFLSDVIQSWPIEDWRAVPFAHIPRWISYRLLSRNTLGWIDDHPDGAPKAVDVLRQLYDGMFPVSLPLTTNLTVVESRLLDWVSPAAFEHLVCDLLQLENPNMNWLQIGGSGDGGVDGIGMTDGRLAAAVQCKWKYDADLFELGASVQEPLQKQWGTTAIQVYVATLFGRKVAGGGRPGLTVWNRQDIARLLVKHHQGCAMARSLGVG